MSNGNFPNGSLVMRVWKFDGGAELIAKFQYFEQAELFAQAMLDRDKDRRADVSKWFYLAVCDHECRAQTFAVKDDGCAS